MEQMQLNCYKVPTTYHTNNLPLPTCRVRATLLAVNRSPLARRWIYWHKTHGLSYSFLVFLRKRVKVEHKNEAKKGGGSKRNRAQPQWSQHQAKIHAAVDAYGYPVYIMLSKGQRNGINYAIPVLEHINMEGSQVMADRGYDNYKLIDYIYKNGGEPTIPSKKGAKFERHCDWWLYKERHLVEKYFLNLKGFRRIAIHYDKPAFIYMGFICLASILIWIKWLKVCIFQTHSSILTL